MTSTRTTEEIQKIAQDFERKLFSTRAELSLKKRCWYLVHWVWDNNGTAKMAKIKDALGIIDLTQGLSTTTRIIKCHEVTTGLITIGVRICPQGGIKIEQHQRMSQSAQ